MNNEFITKFRTKNYLIGSFDAYLDYSKDLTRNNLAISEKKAQDIIDSMPTKYRASIQDVNKNYVGYIGIHDVDIRNEIASMSFVVNKTLTKKDKNAIINIYIKWLRTSINVWEIEKIDYVTPTKTKTSIIKYNTSSYREINRSNYLIHGIPNKLLIKFKDRFDLPDLELSCQIVKDDEVLGIIGVHKLLWTNKRANLIVLLEDNYDSENNVIVAEAINDYLDYIHSIKIHNVSIEIPGSDKTLLDIIKLTNMNYYAIKPYAHVINDEIESVFLFQHIPYMNKKRNVRLPQNKIRKLSDFNTSKKELDKIIEIDVNYKMVSPSVFKDNNIDFDKVLDGHIKAMQVRSRFTVPLGEDKYFLQK